jgi:predicted LPLAT superfamily acyltransferase
MKIDLKNDQQIVAQVFDLLLENLEPSTVARFWQICSLGTEDYSQIKDKLFEGETVDSLYDKITAQETQD